MIRLLLYEQQSVSLRTLPPQQRYQPPSTLVPILNCLATSSQTVVRGCGGQRAAVGVAQQAALVVHRTAGGVDRPARVVDRLAIAGPQREAPRVDPRHARRVRAGAGREGVPAEVKGAGLARRHQP